MMKNIDFSPSLSATQVSKVMAAREDYRDLASTITILRKRPELAERIRKIHGDAPLKAFRTWADRQDRTAHPQGYFDGAKRWEPDPEERRSCCASIRSPSRAFPFSLNKHCRGIEHIASLTNVDVNDIKSVGFALIRLDALEDENLKI